MSWRGAGSAVFGQGSCQRATLTCSSGFPVAAPQTQVCRFPLRQGPTRCHPIASGDIGATSEVCASEATIFFFDCLNVWQGWRQGRIDVNTICMYNEATFAWDEGKRVANIAKHGIDFADVREMFAGPMLVSSDTR